MSDNETSKWRGTNTVQQWNALVPIGTEVRYYPLAMESEHSVTKTRSEAWILGHGAAVVLVEGKSGGVAIDHLQIVHEQGGETR
jgi:hypothetical protein